MLTVRKNKKKQDGRLFYYLMFALPIIQFCIFYIGVNINSILLAFKSYDALTGEYSVVGFANFFQFIENITADPALGYAIQNSIIKYVCGWIFSTPFSLLFSYYIFKKKFAYKAMRVLLFLPSILSAMIMSLIFLNISGHILPAFGLEDYLARVDTRFAMIIFFNIWIGFGGGVLLYSSAMSSISPSIIEAAHIDGVGAVGEFFHIVMPGIYPTFTTFVVTGVAGIFIDQANVYNFYAEAADIHAYTIGYYLFTQIVGKAAGYTSYPYAAAAGLLFTAVAAPTTLLIKLLMEKFGPSEE